MEDPIKIACTEPGCPGYVEYEPRPIPILTAFHDAGGKKWKNIVPYEDFKIVRDEAMKALNSPNQNTDAETKLLKAVEKKKIYLTCTPENHTRPYEILA